VPRSSGSPACSTTWLKPFEALDSEVERELLTLAMALARQNRAARTEDRPTQIIGIIRDAIAALPVAARDVRVHLHPEDAAVVRQHLAPTESERAWGIVEDPVMSRGGCRIITPTSRIDARLEITARRYLERVARYRTAGAAGARGAGER
jgi:flagellar assembly protein FliH